MSTNDKEILDQLQTALRNLPEVEWIEAGDENLEADHELRLLVRGEPVQLIVEFKKSVFPRDIQQLLWVWKNHASPSANDPLQIVRVVAAESISTGARDLLKHEHTGYFAGGGSLYLPTPSALFYIDKPASKAAAKTEVTLYGGRSGDLVLYLLNRGDSWFNVKELAAEVGVAASTASNLMSTLDRMALMETQGRGPSKQRRLTEPSALLEGWAATLRIAPKAAMRRYWVPNVKGQLASALHAAFKAEHVNYRFTGEIAAQAYSPYLTHSGTAHCRVEADAPNLAQALRNLGAKPVTEGANLLITESRSPLEAGYLIESHEGLYASPVQVYLDLLQGKGRSQELAEHLRKERICF